MQGTRSIALWLLVGVGLGIIGYGGYQWYTADQLDPGEMKLAVELAYQADVAKERKQVGDDWKPSAQWQHNRRAANRKAIVKQTSGRADNGKSWIIAGVALLIFSAGRLFAVPLTRRNAGNS